MPFRSYGRREILAGFASCSAAALAGGSFAFAQGDAKPRLAAIDWAMLETACAIGHPPVAACELIRFRAENGAVSLLPQTTDLGLRGSPNFELLSLSKPDLILSSPFYTRVEDRLETIAPVISLPFFNRGEPPLPLVMDALTSLADAIGDPSSGQATRDAAERRFDDLAHAVRAAKARPVMLIDFGDARHFRAFGVDSLYGSTLDRIGLANAWHDKTAFSFSAPVALERLADIADAVFVLVSEIPIEAREQLSRSVLWNALEPVKAGRVVQLPPSNAFGGVPSALQFAGDLVEALALS